MAEFKKKNGQKFWHSPLSLVVIFCVIVLFAYNMFGLIQKNREVSKKKALQMETVDALRKREGELTNNINKLSTEEGIEESIRDKYQVAKVGESVVIIVDEQSQSINLAPVTKEEGFWAFVKKVFKRN